MPVHVDMFINSARIAVSEGITGLIGFHQHSAVMHEVMQRLIPVIEAAYNEKPAVLEGEFKLGDDGKVTFIPDEEGGQNGS